MLIVSLKVLFISLLGDGVLIVRLSIFTTTICF